MKNYKLKIQIALGLAFIGAISACSPKLDAPALAPSAGNANFTRFVAIGNSLTAGYADGALYRGGQENSFAKMLNEQLVPFGANAPLMPWMPVNANGTNDLEKDRGFTLNTYGTRTVSSSRFVLKVGADCQGTVSVGPKRLFEDQSLADPYFNEVLKTVYNSNNPINILGVPGMKMIQCTYKGLGNVSNLPAGLANPFFVRMAKDGVTSSVVGDALLQNPSFFTFFLGNNDVLLYAVEGGVGVDSISGIPAFTYVMNSAIDSLTARGAKGVIGNIPNVITTPHFTTIPWNGLTLDTTAATQLNSGYAPLIAAGLVKKFHVGANGFIIATKNPPYMRSATDQDYMLLSTPLDSVRCFGYGSFKPMPSAYVLDIDEVVKVNAATGTFNALLKQKAEQKGLAFADVNALLKTIQSGIIYDGTTVNSTFVTGGGFSLDGIHLTPRGNAILANCFIDAINAKFGSNISTLNTSKYPGVKFP